MTQTKVVTILQFVTVSVSLTDQTISYIIYSYSYIHIMCLIYNASAIYILVYQAISV